MFGVLLQHPKKQIPFLLAQFIVLGVVFVDGAVFIFLNYLLDGIAFEQRPTYESTWVNQYMK